MRTLAIAVALLLASPATALSYVYSGTFTPSAADDQLRVEFGRVDTSGMGNPDVSDFGVSGVYLVSFKLGAPALSEFTLYSTEVFDEYADDGSYLGGDEQLEVPFYSDSLGQGGSVLYKIPRGYVIKGNYGTTYGYYLAALSLTATFPVFDAPIAFQVRADRLGDVPEPAAWALLVTGFGLTGAALRRRRGYVAA